eukprot:scaffold8995_cov139-Cylindrotheca_fusiformis.AAC.3
MYRAGYQSPMSGVTIFHGITLITNEWCKLSMRWENTLFELVISSLNSVCPSAGAGLVALEPDRNRDIGDGHICRTRTSFHQPSSC